MGTDKRAFSWRERLDLYRRSGSDQCGTYTEYVQGPAGRKLTHLPQANETVVLIIHVYDSRMLERWPIQLLQLENHRLNPCALFRGSFSPKRDKFRAHDKA